MMGCQQSPQGATAGADVAAAKQAAVVKLQAGEQGAPIDDLLDVCGWKCKAFADGEVNISGIQSLDAFFAASANLQVQAASLKADVQLELVNIAAALGVDGAATMSIDELNAAIKAKIDGKLDGHLKGGIKIVASPAKCQVSAKASLEASAKCDASVKGGEAKVECSGSCEAEASAMASCSADATLTCSGTAPSFKCEGSCTGGCDLTAGGTCEGECSGSCEVKAQGDCDGKFTASTEAGAADGSGTCELNAGATCNGTCKGHCELKAGGNCSGECKGSCEYTPPDAKCQGGATAKCEAKAGAKVECSGKCDGEVKPPMVKADCEATAKADAQFSAECTPPSVDIKYELEGTFAAMLDGDVAAKAKFEGQIQAVGHAFAEIAAKGAKLKAVVAAGGGLAEAGVKAVGDTIASLATATDADVVVGAYCAGKSIDTVGSALTDSVADLNATLQATVDVAATFAGS
jgi:hypothetical protein